MDAAAWLGQDDLKFAEGGNSADCAPLSRDEPALVLMTSGTTGVPKGVTLSLAALSNRIKLNLKHIPKDALQRVLCVLPLSFGHGLIGNSLTALFARSELNFLIKPEMTELADFGAFLDRCNITFLSSVPAFWRMVLRLSPPPNTPSGRVHIGSAPLSIALWGQIADWCGTREVHNLYGMTETANWISSAGLDQEGAADGAVGTPWGGTFAVYRDGQFALEGRGEVAIKSPSSMIGYWDLPEKTSEVLKDGYFLTGDIGELSVDGNLTLVGRIKNEINVGGIKVLAEEVDALLERHPDVIEACAFPLDDPISGEIVGAIAVVDCETDSDNLREWCRTRARSEAVPRQIKLVDAVPRNDRGKPDRTLAKNTFLKT